MGILTFAMFLLLTVAAWAGAILIQTLYDSLFFVSICLSLIVFGIIGLVDDIFFKNRLLLRLLRKEAGG